MDEITLISMNKYLIEDNHFKYKIILQNMQDKNISHMFAIRIEISVPRESVVYLYQERQTSINANPFAV
jgi:hypothetical protein